MRTADDGSFAVTDAPVGRLFVHVENEDVVSPRTLHVPVDGVRDVEVRIAPRAELRVRVMRGSAPVRNAAVSVHGSAAVSEKEDTTNMDGVAIFRGLGDAMVRVVATADGDFAVDESVALAPRTSTSVSLDLAAGRQVEGRVIDERGAPVDGATVAFVPMSSSDVGGGSAVTADDGTFRGGPLRGPATYRAVVTRSGARLATREKGSRAEIAVPASGPPSPAKLEIVVVGDDQTITGVVVDDAGGPVPDARVGAFPGGIHDAAVASTFSGHDGSFTLRGLSSGPYVVRARGISGAEAKSEKTTAPSHAVRLVLPRVGSLVGTVKGFSGTPSVMAWHIDGYDADYRPALVASGRFRIEGLSAGKYHVAASTEDAAAQATVEIRDETPVAVTLTASSTRALHGKAIDFIAGGPLPNLACQIAPYAGGGRSPVVVPGTFFTGADGAFSVAAVPASDLYMWCLADGGPERGGVARIPAALGEDDVTLFGLDLTGKPSGDPDLLGLETADDFPFSRRVASVEPKSVAGTAGLEVGDVIEKIGDRSVAELGNGVVRRYLAFVLAERKQVAVEVIRGGAAVVLGFGSKP